MTSPVITFLNSVSSKTAGTTLANPVPSRTWAVGDIMLAQLSMDPTAGAVTFTAVTNFGAWSSNVDAVQGSVTTGARTVSAWCFCTTGFTGTPSVTANFPSTTAKCVSVYAVTGCDSVNPVRGTNTGIAASGFATFTLTATAGANFDALAVALGGCETVSGAGFTFSTGGWTAAGSTTSTVGTSGGSTATNISVGWGAASASGVAAGGGTTLQAGQAACAITGYIFSGVVAPTLPSGVVQLKSGSSATTSLTITLDAPTGSGNSLVVVIAASGTANNPTAIACTLGGVTGNFVQDTIFGSSTDAGIGAVWRNQPAASGQTAVGITATGGTGTIAIMATVYEVNDLAASPFDKTANSVSAGATTWTSTATAATTQATERLFGGVFTAASGASTITGPTSPWTNTAQINQVQGSFTDGWIAGVQNVVSTGTYTYNGTVSPSSQWIAKIATYKLSTGAAVGILPQQAKKRMPAIFTRIAAPRRRGVYSR